ncbi:MAG TPA: Holliday junction branch migration protein RuvA [Acidimicrobiales bacterium]|nr:Holliday junction branch migration protein RuvA [Acidimicrobiales bacterium]
MIGSLRGVVLERGAAAAAGEVLIEVGGVGYRVAVPTGTLALAEPGAAFFLHVHTHVREDAIVLYGFATRAERLAFEALVSVHGVGPALALAILSTHAPASLQRIVLTEDGDALTQVPGIGAKTAVRLLLELRSKLDLIDLGEPLEVVSGGPDAVTAGAGNGDARADVRAALASLGYGADEIRETVGALPPSDDPAALLRAALQQLAGAR